MVKWTLTLFMLISFILPAFGQEYESFRIDNPADYDVELLAKAFKNDVWDSYRKMNEENTITFANGAVVSLFPAQRLLDEGKTVNVSKVLPADTPPSTTRTFVLHSSGVVIEQHSYTPVKSKTDRSK